MMQSYSGNCLHRKYKEAIILGDEIRKGKNGKDL